MGMHYLHTLALLYKQLVLNKQKLYKDVAIAGEPNSAGFGSCVFPQKVERKHTVIHRKIMLLFL